ncbi:MAG: DNA gyrase subunit A [Candidatus Omnitrophota bacterium]
MPEHINEKIVERYLEEEMKESYLSYAMSVIVGRALPDVRDGLKPVQRRILYTMHELHMRYNQAHKKCAKVVGFCLGQYHPHGDTAVYEALVRMAQEFSLRYPVVNGQGNFGCFTKDTEVALCDGKKLSFEELIKEQKQGKRHWTFTYNSKEKKIEITEIKKPRLTRKNERILKVTIDNGEEIKCTHDHLFMLRDGSYKKAKDLISGESLMPLYVESYKGSDVNLKNYLEVYQPILEKKEFIHRLADKWKDPSYKEKVVRSKILGYAKALLEQYGELSPEIYEKGRYNNAIPKVGKAVSFFNNDFKELTSAAADYVRNHKVEKIEFLEDREDVYDLTVAPWHNFALGAGVFVHNSIDGDPPAAQRYTECRLSRISDYILQDIEKNTVNFFPNFDNSLTEPEVLPSVVPNMLLNGASGIAVGMATNIPPHNLKEICDAVEHLIDNPKASVKDLYKYVKGPDFPTGGIICGKTDILNMYKSGRGKLCVRAKATIEHPNNKTQIIITEIPYQLNKTTLMEQIANLINNKRVEGIADLRDESDKDGIRIVLELKRDIQAEIVLNRLYKHTSMETTFGAIFLVLVNRRPQVLNLKEMLSHHINFRKEVIIRRTNFELDKAERRAHILEGLKIALQFLDQVIEIIKKSKNPQEAKAALMKKFKLSELQTQAILEMQLQRLCALEREKIEQEYLELLKRIEYLKSILSSEKKQEALIKEELKEIKEKFADNRRTDIVSQKEEIEVEDLIVEEDMAVTISRAGYIKRMPLTAYRQQKRGGRGVTAMSTSEEDIIKHLFVASSKDTLLFFTDEGRIYPLKTYGVPQGSRISKGRAIVNLLQLGAQANITAVLSIKEFGPEQSIFMATQKGMVKRSSLDLFDNIRKSGIAAIGLSKGDSLVGVHLARENDMAILATKKGLSIKFKIQDVRLTGRQSQGVRGIKLSPNDIVLGAALVQEGIKKEGMYLLTATENGFAKRTDVEEYRTQSRSGKGVINMKLSPKIGDVQGVVLAKAEDEVICITQQGVLIRSKIKDIRASGRSTQGVRVINLDKGDKLSSIARIIPED